MSPVWEENVWEEGVWEEGVWGTGEITPSNLDMISILGDDIEYYYSTILVGSSVYRKKLNEKTNFVVDFNNTLDTRLDDRKYYRRNRSD